MLVNDGVATSFLEWLTPGQELGGCGPQFGGARLLKSGAIHQGKPHKRSEINVQGLKTRRAVAHGIPRLGAFHGVTLRRGCALHKCFG